MTNRNMMSLSKMLLLLLLAVAATTVSAQDRPLKDDSQKLLKLHGSLMVVAWCIVFPLGALLAVFRHKVGKDKPLFSFMPNFYIPHTIFQMFGFILVVLSMVCAVRAVYLNWGIGNPFKNEFVLNQDIEFYPWNKHVKWGLATLFLLLIQMVLGYVHHVIKQSHDKKLENGTITTPWKRWIVPSWLHVLLGPTLIIIANLTIIQGFQLYYFNHFPNLYINEPPPAVIRFGYSAVLILGIGFISIYTLGKLTQPDATPASSSSNNNENKNQPDDNA